MKPWRVVFQMAGIAAGFLAGLAVGWFLPQQPPQDSPHEAVTSARAESSVPFPIYDSRPPPPSVPFSLSDLRTVIREELQAELAEHDLLSKEAQPIVKEDLERQHLVYEEASGSLHRALSQGTWTQEDRQQLRGVLHKLSVPQQDQLIGELFGAIQSGRLKVEGEGAPL